MAAQAKALVPPAGCPTAAQLREHGTPVPGKPGVYQLWGALYYSAELLGGSRG